jgi:hypothetical protein
MNEPRPDPASPRVSGAGCRNTIVVIVLLGLAGFVWSYWVPHGSFGADLARFVAPLSFGILLLTIYGIAVNVVPIVDWFRVPEPPVIEHPVLGTVRYEGMRWSGHARDLAFSFEGRRMGPDPELIDALAHAVANCDAFAARAREFSRSHEFEIGLPGWIYARRESGTVVTDWEFADAEDREVSVRVSFRGDQPVDVERHESLI